MRDNAEVNIVPLNQVVWDAWLAKNRAKEKRLNARLAMAVVVIVIAGLLLSVAWLVVVRYHTGAPSTPSVTTSSGVRA
ncbi:MAG TPA: hypothetical protein VJ728_02975 [Candidatus Binataceae bacterium]|nr:hypothetical protein [Candidatus Binataceae bacterium]